MEPTRRGIIYDIIRPLEKQQFTTQADKLDCHIVLNHQFHVPWMVWKHNSCIQTILEASRQITV